MKRYRHYNKGMAVVLSCFGSVVEQQKYIELQDYIKQNLEELDIYLAFSSRMVLKLLKKKGIEYKNLPQVLADVDMAGYKNIIVSSINLFPTSEHTMLESIVNGFDSFSLANVRAADAIFTKAKETTNVLLELNSKLARADTANLYIIHGAPTLDNKGLGSIEYVSAFLKELNDNNFCCSLEGSFAFGALKGSIKAKIKKLSLKKIKVVPLLLVSGNHFVKDMVEIKEELEKDFEVEIATSLTKSPNFNLIEMDSIKDIILKNIKEQIAKLG